MSLVRYINTILSGQVMINKLPVLSYKAILNQEAGR